MNVLDVGPDSPCALCFARRGGSRGHIFGMGLMLVLATTLVT